MADMAFYRCDVPGCGATIESEMVNDPKFATRMAAHKRSHRLPVGTRVRITERWALHAGRTGIVVHHDSGMSVYVRLDDEGARVPTLSEWRNGDGNWVWYSVAAERESLEVIEFEAVRLLMDYGR